MLKKIKIIGTEASFYDRGQIQQRVNLKEVEEVYFNTGFVKQINILKIGKKTIWKLQLTDDESIFALPFKL